MPPLQLIGDRVRQARGAEIILEHALDDQREAEGQQQAVELIEPRQPSQHGPFEDHAENADHDRREEQRPPIVDAEHVEQEIGAERAHHIERAMGEIDDVEHAEDHGEAETEQRVERAVDQADQQLGEQACMGSLLATQSSRTKSRRGPPHGRRSRHHFLTSGHALSDSGRNASSAGMVATSL